MDDSDNAITSGTGPHERAEGVPALTVADINVPGQKPKDMPGETKQCSCVDVRSDVSNMMCRVGQTENTMSNMLQMLQSLVSTCEIIQADVSNNKQAIKRVESDLASSIESLRLDMQKMQRRVDEVHAALTLLGDVSMSKKKKPLKDVLF